jgi:uncharacterized membrane protein
MRIAVVGAGISGLVSAWLLQEKAGPRREANHHGIHRLKRASRAREEDEPHPKLRRRRRHHARLELLWLGVIAPPIYKATIGPLLEASPDLLAAALFCLIYLVGVSEFVICAAPSGARPARVAARGALFGFVAYATFDLTALAVLEGWSPLITVVDMAWGTLLTASVAGLTRTVTGRRRA